MAIATHQDFLRESAERLCKKEVPHPSDHRDSCNRMMEAVDAILRRHVSDRMASDIADALYLAYQAGRRHPVVEDD